MIIEFSRNGILPEIKPAELSSAVLQSFLDQAMPGAYIAIQAYVQPSTATDQALLDLRLKLRERTCLATTVGYGPRFLHSTGQLHKGDAGKGLFIQLTSQAVENVVIPDEAGQPDWTITFNTLKSAQVLGDQQALLEAGRKVILFDLGASITEKRLRNICWMPAQLQFSVRSLLK